MGRIAWIAWIASAALCLSLSACTGEVAFAPTATVTTTVTAVPQSTPSASLDELALEIDAQHVVDLVCRLQDSYGDFQDAMMQLQLDPGFLAKSKKKAQDVVFAIDAMQSLLVIGPEGDWSDPWFALNALRIADMIASSRVYFESASTVSNADEMTSMGFGVLDNPVGPEDASALSALLPPPQVKQLGECVRL